MEMIGKVLKLKNADAVSVHHTTQYKKLRQDVTDDERDDEEDDVVFLRKGIELKQQNGFEVDRLKLGTDSDLDLRPSRKSRLPSENIQVKQGGARKRTSLKKRPAYLLLTFIVAMVTISALVAFTLHRHKTKISRSWIQEFVDSEGTSNVVLQDVDGDGIQDIIISITTNQNMSSARLNKRTSSQTIDSLCSLKENKSPCRARLVAMRGRDGDILWQTSVPYGLTAIKCGVIDVDRDKSPDCIASGPFAGLVAFSPITGHVIWTGNFTTLQLSWQVVGVDVLVDLNGDDVVDMVAMQTKQDAIPGNSTNKSEHRSLLLLVDGLTGNVLGRPIGVKGGCKFSPLVWKFKDRSVYIVYGTGGPGEEGSLFAVSLRDFYSNVMSSETKKPLVTTDSSTFKVSKTHFNNFDTVGGIINILRSDRLPGVIVRPLFVDFDGDGVEDMLVASCDGNISLFTGTDNRILWSLSFSEHHVTREMVPGYFNDDEHPDVLLYLNLKPHANISAPSSVVIILSGSTGSLIWSFNDSAVEFPTRNLVTVTTEKNRDFFLFWLKRQTSLEERVKRHIRNSGSPLPRRSKVFPKMRSHSPPHEDYFSYNRRPYLYDGGNAYIPGDGVDYRSASEYGVDPDQPLPSRSRPYPPEYYNRPDEADDYGGDPTFRDLRKSTGFSTSKSTKAWTSTSSPGLEVKCRSRTERSFLVGTDRFSAEDPFVVSREEAFHDVERSSKDLPDGFIASKSNVESPSHLCLSAVIQSLSSVLGDVDGDQKADLISMTSFVTTEGNQKVGRSSKTTNKLLVSKISLQTKLSEVIRTRIESLTSPLPITSPFVDSPLKASRTMSETDLSRYLAFGLLSPEDEFQTNQ